MDLYSDGFMVIILIISEVRSWKSVSIITLCQSWSPIRVLASTSFRGCAFACHLVDERILLASWLFVGIENSVVSQFQEMNLLVEADLPGNQLDDYISRLNAILSQKAAGILQLQNQLAHFQKRLKEHNVLVSSGH